MKQLNSYWGAVRNKYHSMKLSTKLFLTYAVILTIPALFITLFLTGNAEKKVIRESVSESARIVEQVYSKIYQNVKLLENTITIAGKQADFLEFCNSDMNADGLKLVKFSQNELKQMNYIFQSNDLIHHASFYFYNEDLYEIWDTIYQFQRFGNPEFADRVRREHSSIYRLSGVTEKGTGYVSCYREIYINTEPVAILEISVEPELFFQPAFEADGNDERITCILSEDGASLLSDPGNILWEETRDALPDIRKLLTEDLSYGTKTLEEREDIYDITYKYVPAIHSYVFQVLSRDSITKGIWRTKMLMFSGGVLILILLYFISSVMSRKVTKPLIRVVQSMNKIQQGNMNAMIDVPDTGGNEFDSIGRNYNMMLEKISVLMKENVERQLSAKNAELKALQSQINSHFLYNALESIRMMAEVENRRDIADSVVSLGNLMRYSMSWKNQNVTLGEELDHIKNYIFFYNLIHDTRIIVTMDLQEEHREQVVLKMCLQPFVENAIIHGMLPGEKNLHLRLHAKIDQKNFIITLLDNGAGIEPSRLKQIQSALEGISEWNRKISNSGIGLENVHRRIQMNYGLQYGVTIHSEAGKFTEIQLVTPCKAEDLGGW